MRAFVVITTLLFAISRILICIFSANGYELGHHATQTYQAFAHFFVGCCFGAWLALKRAWNALPDGALIPDFLYENRRKHLWEAVVILSIVEVGAASFTVVSKYFAKPTPVPVKEFIVPEEIEPTPEKEEPGRSSVTVRLGENQPGDVVLAPMLTDINVKEITDPGMLSWFSNINPGSELKMEENHGRPSQRIILQQNTD